jgi:hypothetical protein
MVSRKRRERDNSKPKLLKYWKDGIRVVEIPLYDIPDTTLPRVIMSLHAFERLMNLGMTAKPRVNGDGYIEIRCPYTETYVNLVYLVANINSDQKVTFKDDNRCNMVESNLIIEDRDLPISYVQKHLNAELTGTYWDTIEMYDLDEEKAKLRIPRGNEEWDAWIYKNKNTPTEDLHVRDMITKEEI